MDSTDSMDILKFRMESFDNSWNGTSCWREMDYEMEYENFHGDKDALTGNKGELDG